jgi:hypothetical protein
MDENSRLIRLSEQGRFWSVPFAELSPPERVFRAIWDLESEVNNGGFHQYFFNSSGDTAFAVVGALEAIGAPQAAQIVRAANRIFPHATPPADRVERQAHLEAISPEHDELLEQLDQDFYSYPDNLTELLMSYVNLNRSSFQVE